MWYPPAVVLPCVYEPYSNTEDQSVRFMWQMIPVDQRVFRAVNEAVGFYSPTHTEDIRKFLLNRSVFDLVRVSNCLELTDTKLLGWYLSLPAEDRAVIQQEGGLFQFLQKHPALEIVRQFIYVKQLVPDRVSQRRVRRNSITPPPTAMSTNLGYTKVHGVSKCLNCGTSCPFGTKKCSNCILRILNSEEKIYMPEDEKDLELIPNNVRDELNIITAKSEVSQSTLNLQVTSAKSQQNNYDSSHAVHPSHVPKGAHNSKAQYLSQLWEEVEQKEDTKHFKDPTAQASFSLDLELNMHSQTLRNDHTQNKLDRSHKKLEAGADGCDLDQETLAEYYSFNSASLDHTTREWSDGSQNMEGGNNDSLMATKGSTELSDEPSEITMASTANSTECFSCLDNSSGWADDAGNFHDDQGYKDESRYGHQMEKNQLISLESPVKSTPSVKCGGPAPVFVNQMVDTCGDFRACFTSTRSTEVDRISQFKACRDVAAETESLTISNEKDTQTMQKSTSEKNTVTEVYMADLDVLTEEFIKLKEMEQELKQMKNRKARPSSSFAEKGGADHCGRDCECDCAQRVKQAELHLLALQFIMCQQHCWRRYFTSPLGESAHQGIEALPDIMSETLNTLKKDYLDMRRQILAGTPLDDLKPLTVDSLKMPTGSHYSPAMVLEAHSGLLDLLGSTVANDLGVENETKEMRADLNTVSTQNDSAEHNCPKGDGDKRGLNKQPQASSMMKFVGGIKEMNSTEAWFDAEEELGSANQDGKTEKETEEKELRNCKMEQKGTDEDESNQRSLLCVTNLPSNVTEPDMLLWFEKYNAVSASISTFSNNIRAAIVYLKSSTDAKAAVKDLNGCSLRGHIVHVQQLCGPVAADPKQSDDSINTSENFKAEPAGNRPDTKGVTNSRSIPRGLRCSVDRLTNVHDSPTASGTCVPQHYATMGSFDTIMARLTERHPNIGRQKIVDALLELRAKHQGFLSGLPLRSIVDMTSELLTQASVPK